ncbi:MAG TPA: PAS domain-containing protein [Candidatus Limnocylindrales bacterium]|nr:PAS domain-containing protein [Candidatus Limnocylindrales bacterium]
MAPEPAVVIIRSDGTYLDATPAALEILGVTLAQLRASRAGDFAPEPRDVDADAAFRREWEQAGQPDVGGELTLRRPDGELRRVRFVVTHRSADEYAAILAPADGARLDPVAKPPVVFTAGHVLAEWRAAERRLDAVPADSPEWRATQAQIESLRDRYQRLFAARRG